MGDPRLQKKQSAQDGPKRRTEAGLKVAVKAGLLHTVADAIYATPAGKIREAVANSRDNGATWVVINVDRIERSMSIYDNGRGITKSRFREIFESVGHPLPLPGPKLSYFGLGLMSILQLGDRVKVFTRPRGEQGVNLLTVQTKQFFDEANKDKSIESLERFVSLSEAGRLDRGRCSAPVLDEFLASDAIGGVPDSYTEIVIEEMRDSDLEVICKRKFEDDLRKALPLPLERDEPFLSRFPDDSTREKVRGLLENDAFCRTIRVYFGVEDDREITQLWKYFPSFRANIKFEADRVRVAESESGSFAYYIVHTVAEDLHGRRPDGADDGENGHDDDRERETGFWVRNQNFLVKGADFLEQPGGGKRIIHMPLRSWIFGEIFHKDMNAFLTVGRNDYLYDKQEFRDFRAEVVQVVGDLNEQLRTIWSQKNRIRKYLIEPFSKIAEPGGAIQQTERKLARLLGKRVDDPGFYREALKRLKQGLSRADMQDDAARIDKILSEHPRNIVLAEEPNMTVQVAAKVKGEDRGYELAWQKSDNRMIVSLSPGLFKPSEVLFLGKRFEVFFVVKDGSAKGASIDVEGGKIYINPFNAELSHYSISILDVYIALEVANAMSSTKEELRKNFLDLLEPPQLDVGKYIVPLGDDLRRVLRDRQVQRR